MKSKYDNIGGPYDQLYLNAEWWVCGRQLGSYFGATTLAIDLNSDGIDELLIGAPNYVTGV